MTYISLLLAFILSQIFFLPERWNAARCFASYLDQNSDRLCARMNVLEFGAGGGLPGIVAALCGARRVRHFDDSMSFSGA